VSLPEIKSGRIDSADPRGAGRPRCGQPPELGDVIWYSESGVHPNTLARFDSHTEKFEIWAIPSGGGVVRNMTKTLDGSLVLACSGVDRIALVDVR